MPRFTLLGVPWDGSSSFERGAALAPARIREALWSPSTNSSTEIGVSIEPETIADAGDVAMPEDASAARDVMQRAVEAILSGQSVPCALGGDHSVTYPIVRAVAAAEPVTILHVDAHGDLYDEFPLPGPGQPGGLGDRYSHACPFARLLEEGRCARLVQVGIRTMTPHLRAQVARFGVEVFGCDDLGRVPVESLRGPLYVSLDLDGLDPAFAPGVAHPEPGGLSVRDVIGLIHRIRVPLVGLDVVEYNPRFDLRDLTARVAAKLLKELVAVATRNAATVA